MGTEHFDVLIIGAGLSGIGAAHHLQRKCPAKRYAILEGRDRIGGTWSLFKYPGIRSDSDMFTLGYSFRPWKEAKAIADGPAILKYVTETAGEAGIDRHIRFRHQVVKADWSSSESRWMLQVAVGTEDETRLYSCDFLYVCAGYYRYDKGYAPAFPGQASFAGPIIHPQHWPDHLDYSGKRVVVIGSGATAVTLVPAMAGTAAHVTMLQRSPSYIMSLPSKDVVADALRRVLPEKAAHRLTRAKNVLITLLLYQLSRRAPDFVRKLLRSAQVPLLPPGYPIDVHLNPKYKPWDQRLCLVPDADLFKSIKRGQASIATDEIESFVPQGIRLKSGQTLEADIVVTATGLELQACGGIKLHIDGRPVDQSACYVYNGLMLGNVPNMAFCVGYTNASWTLRADLASHYVCRLLNYMDRHGYHVVRPQVAPGGMASQPLLNFTSGYVVRALDRFPKQGPKFPWVMRQNYILDLLGMKWRPIRDGTLAFSKAETATAPADGAVARGTS
jgi:cation diffusion facilitator CzcD-associated flavoprotein CzcO